MKSALLIQGILLAVSSLVSVANAQEYPAADFQPKVVFRDESVAKLTTTENTAAKPCPAKEEKAEFDPQYPAANFQPKVIYSGTGS